MNAKAFCTSFALLAIFACSSEAPSPAPAGGSAGAAGASASAGAPTGGMPSTSAGGSAGLASASAGAATAGGASGSAGAAASGGTAGGTGGTDASSAGTSGASGASGGSSGSAGGSADGWVSIFNGKDLTGWVPLIHKWKYAEDPYNTFRVDPDNGVIRVTYDDYPGKNFDDHCGLLYYDKALTDYRVRVTYRFHDPQANNPVSWGKNNSGLMIFATDPRTVMNDPEFPPLIEIQLIGTPSTGGKNNANLCQPGGITVSKLFGQPLSDTGCHDSKSGTAAAADQWVTVEAEVHVAGDTKIFQYPDMATPVLTFSGVKYKGQAVTGGYLALQSESQPVDFKDIQLKELK